MQLQIPDRVFAGYIFDCDGTLADTMPLHYRAWKRLLDEHGGNFPEDMFYRLGGKTTESIIELLNERDGLKIDMHAGAERKEQYYVELIAEVQAIEPVLRIARQMAGRVPIAVASGGYRKYVELTLAAIGVQDLFDAVVCAEDYARGKPHPDPFLEAARRLNVPPEDCVVFEDSAMGVEAARAAGMACVFVPSAPVI